MGWIYLDGLISAATSGYVYWRYRNAGKTGVIAAHAVALGLFWPAFWTLLAFERGNRSGSCQ